MVDRLFDNNYQLEDKFYYQMVMHFNDILFTSVLLKIGDS